MQGFKGGVVSALVFATVAVGFAQDELGFEAANETEFIYGDDAKKPTSVAFDPGMVDLTEQEVGSTVTWMLVGMTRRGDVATDRSRDAGLSIDSDANGHSEIPHQWDQLDRTVWVFGDLAKGQVQVQAPTGTRIRVASQEDFGLRRRRPAFVARGLSYSTLWLRPGEGVWTSALRDGFDEDGVLNGSVGGRLADFQDSLGNAAPSWANNGDLFVFVEEKSLNVSIVEVN